MGVIHILCLLPPSSAALFFPLSSSVYPFFCRSFCHPYITLTAADGATHLFSFLLQWAATGTVTTQICVDIILAHKIAFKCKFPLGPKGDLASALALLIWTNMWSVLICIMGRMEMRGQLCQPKTKRRKKKGRQTDAILLNCICTTQRCDILSLIWPLLIMIRGYIEHCHSHGLTKAL